jgi:hypothetical protein
MSDTYSAPVDDVVYFQQNRSSFCNNAISDQNSTNLKPLLSKLYTNDRSVQDNELKDWGLKIEKNDDTAKAMGNVNNQEAKTIGSQMPINEMYDNYGSDYSGDTYGYDSNDIKTQALSYIAGRYGFLTNDFEVKGLFHGDDGDEFCMGIVYSFKGTLKDFKSNPASRVFKVPPKRLHWIAIKFLVNNHSEETLTNLFYSTNPNALAEKEKWARNIYTKAMEMVVATKRGTLVSYRSTLPFAVGVQIAGFASTVYYGNTLNPYAFYISANTFTAEYPMMELRLKEPFDTVADKFYIYSSFGRSTMQKSYYTPPGTENKGIVIPRTSALYKYIMEHSEEYQINREALEQGSTQFRLGRVTADKVIRDVTEQYEKLHTKKETDTTARIYRIDGRPWDYTKTSSIGSYVVNDHKEYGVEFNLELHCKFFGYDVTP